MVKYRIEVKKSAAKEIENLPSPYLKKVVDKFAQLENNPRPEECTKLSSLEKFRLRVDSYRILYEIRDDLLIVYVVKVAHRKSVYR